MIDTYLQIQCITIPVVYEVIVDSTWKPEVEIELAVFVGTGCPSACPTEDRAKHATRAEKLWCAGHDMAKMKKKRQKAECASYIDEGCILLTSKVHTYMC